MLRTQMATHRFKKHFTLEEARALLPTLRSLFASIRKDKAAHEEAEELLAKQLDRTGGDVGGDGLDPLVRSMADLRERLLEIARLGVQIKDLERGLVDFPAIREGREVFLCWELEEDDIEFWHDLDSGYAGRERL
jgi:hypothetical protein